MDYTNAAGRPTLKRSYTNMAHAGAPPPILDYSGASRAPHDDHYHNLEHQPQRRRFENPWHQRTAQQHFPGDGLDFRRPIMSAHSTMDTIDLTGERREHAISQPSLALSGAPDHAAASGTASRVQRPPRFPRDIIDLADSDEEEQQHQPVQRPAQNQHTTGNLHMLGRDDLFMPQMEADEDSLFIPEAPPTRPTTAGLRRPGYRRRPTPAMEFDDVEIVSSRPISRNVSRRATPAVFMPGQTATDNPPPRQSANDPIDLTADDDDEVIHTNTRPLPSINGERPAMAGSGIGTRERPLARGDFGIGRLVERIRGRDGMRGMRGQDAMTANFLNRYANMNYGNNEDAAARSHAAHDIARRRADQAHERTMRAEEQLWRARERPDGVPGRIVRQRGHVVMNPITMDYNELGFDIMGVGPPEPATPKYEPPPPAEKGFTRSPEEDEEVVCPNCGDELAVGKEEMKQQIWVVKGCGHAYCGECATRTRPTTSKKGKGRALDPSTPPHLKKCVVVGCEKPATKKDMIHVYMSS